jgi:hypothetical protein
MPVWPNAVSASVSAILAIVLCARRNRLTAAQCSTVFVLNCFAATFALWHTSGWFATAGRAWIPFQANKLGALSVPLFMPLPWAGLLSVGMLALMPIVKYYVLPVDLRATIAVGEPWITLAYGIFGATLLLYRWRTLHAEREAFQLSSERVALERFARKLLAIRDLTNTPVQTIGLTMVLIRKHFPEAENLLDPADRALTRLEELNRVLSVEETRLGWQPGEESFDSFQILGNRSGRDDL